MRIAPNGRTDGQTAIGAAAADRKRRSSRASALIFSLSSSQNISSVKREVVERAHTHAYTLCSCNNHGFKAEPAAANVSASSSSSSYYFGLPVC